MTREELVAELRRLGEGEGRDIEADHMTADALLLTFIGDAEVIVAFHGLHKWYS